MGYEIKLIIGKASANVSDEWALTDKKYEDGSGFEPQRDASGGIVHTGRKEHWFKTMATVDLCKLCYDSPLSSLCADSHKTAKATEKTMVHYFYAEDGNTRVVEDRYGSPMWPIPIRDFLAVAKADADANTYRRLKWAIALLESMADDKENLSILAFGH